VDNQQDILKFTLNYKIHHQWSKRKYLFGKNWVE